jgi:hypothetical protein
VENRRYYAAPQSMYAITAYVDLLQAPEQQWASQANQPTSHLQHIHHASISQPGAHYQYSQIFQHPPGTQLVQRSPSLQHGAHVQHVLPVQQSSQSSVLLSAASTSSSATLAAAAYLGGEVTLAPSDFKVLFVFAASAVVQ